MGTSTLHFLTSLHTFILFRQLYQITLGLKYLHAEGIVHGDLHAGNILIDNNEGARITDFGMSLIAEATAYNYASIHGGGALRWQAPELIDPEEFNLETSRPTTQSDVFSIACTAIEVRIRSPHSAIDTDPHDNQLYSGRPPFPELADHQVSNRYVKGKRPPRPPLPGSGPGFMSDAMWSIIEACWSQDRLDRPSSRDVSARIAANGRLPSLPLPDGAVIEGLSRSTLYERRVARAYEPLQGISYRGFPFFTLHVGDEYGVLQELGSNSAYPDLPLALEQGDLDDSLLLLRNASMESGLALARFFNPMGSHITEPVPVRAFGSKSYTYVSAYILCY